MRYHESEVQDKSELRSNGLYHCRVSKAVATSGEKIKLSYTDLRDGTYVGVDWLDFTPKYRWIAHKKIKALGVQKDVDGFYDFEVGDLVGFTVKIYWIQVPDKYDPEKIYFNVDSRRPDTECGYVAPEEVVPF